MLQRAMEISETLTDDSCFMFLLVVLIIYTLENDTFLLYAVPLPALVEIVMAQQEGKHDIPSVK